VKVLIAPNALKGSLSAREAATVMARSLPKDWDAVLCPIADGGDGTLECLVEATGGKYFSATVTGPLSSRKVSAKWGRLGTSNTAVIEMAEASGLRFLSPNEYSAANTSTRGVGELILRALDDGYRDIAVGLGGSATNDGGAGCAQALGVRLLDSHGVDLRQGGTQLRTLQTFDTSRLDKRISMTSFTGLADVSSPLLGPTGATRMFGIQKGAGNEELSMLEEALSHYADTLQQQLHRDVAGIPGSGAAGGLGAGLMAFFGAKIVSGIDYVLDVVRFDELLRDCDMVLTAEGKIDEQSLFGKGVAGIARRAMTLNKPVHAFAGRIVGNSEDLCARLNLASIHGITPSFIYEKEAFSRVRELLSLKLGEFLATHE
jgi:glycerate kinase